jgi:Pyruvate/2-oxoacid:ferredoxin oxidoreductase delta subunit
MSERRTWQELELGVELPAATSLSYRTGGWRVLRPILNASECTHCGICAHECPSKAISMVREEEAEQASCKL